MRLLKSSLFKEKASKRAQAALRSEAALRAQLKHQLKVKETAAKAGKTRSRASKRLEECPGVKGPSASGKRIRKLPTYWEEQPEVKPELIPQVVKDELKQATAGLIGGLDATFSFSPKEEKTFLAGEYRSTLVCVL